MPAQRIIEINLEFRTTSWLVDKVMSFESLLCFGERGNGDMFFYPIMCDGNIREVIFEWNHETDERIWFAINLDKFLKRMFIKH